MNYIIFKNNVCRRRTEEKFGKKLDNTFDWCTTKEYNF